MPKIKNQLQLICTACNNIAYTVFAQKECDMLISQLNNQGWSKLLLSTDNECSLKYSYKAAAFINSRTKQIIIANAGTSSYSDAITNIQIYLHHVPSKFTAIKSFIDQIYDLISQDSKINLEDYQIITTGHSAGAVMSDLLATELYSRGVQKIKSITFENPGSKSTIERAITDQGFSCEISDQCFVEIEFVIYNARPNFLNSVHAQCANVELIMNILNHSPSVKNSANNNSYYMQKIRDSFKSVYNFFAKNKILESLSEHRLTNFHEYFQYAQNSNQEALTIKIESWLSSNHLETVIQYQEKLVQFIQAQVTSDTTKDRKKYRIFSHKEDEEFPGMVIIDTMLVSYNEIKCYVQSTLGINTGEQNCNIDTKQIIDEEPYNDIMDSLEITPLGIN